MWIGKEKSPFRGRYQSIGSSRNRSVAWDCNPNVRVRSDNGEVFRRSRPSLSHTRQDEEAGLDQEWRCGLGCPLGFPNQSRGRALALHTESSAGTSQQGHSYDVTPQCRPALRTERLLSVLHVSLFMARISVAVRRHNRRPSGTHTYETTDEIAHCWQLLTKERQSSLGDQAAKNNEDCPVLLERLFKE